MSVAPDLRKAVESRRNTGTDVRRVASLLMPMVTASWSNVSDNACPVTVINGYNSNDKATRSVTTWRRIIKGACKPLQFAHERVILECIAETAFTICIIGIMVILIRRTIPLIGARNLLIVLPPAETLPRECDCMTPKWQVF